MMRNLKALGLALAAIFALSAVAASGASAAGEKFHSTVEPTIITGHAERVGTTDVEGTTNIFTAGGGEFKCKTTLVQGTLTEKTESTATVHPTYNECEFAGHTVHVTTNDCAYVLHAETTGTDGPVEVECETGNQIEIELRKSDGSIGCRVKVGPQTPGGGIHYENKETEAGKIGHITATATVTGITYSHEIIEGGTCVGVGNGTGATYTGDLTVKGYEDLGNSGTKTTPIFNMGSQVHIWWE